MLSLNPIPRGAAYGAQNAIMNWGSNDSYEDGFFIGSMDDEGRHLRGTSGWPLSVYRRTREGGHGRCDCVLAYGIQHSRDAELLCALLNAREGVHRTDEENFRP